MTNMLIDCNLLEDFTANDPNLLADLSVLFVRFLPGSLASMNLCLLYTSPSPRDGLLSRMPSSA